VSGLSQILPKALLSTAIYCLVGDGHADSLPDPSYLDLLNVVDLGVYDTVSGNAIAVSPDARYIALETTQADLPHNNMIKRWKVVDLVDQDVLDVGDGGQDIPDSFDGTRTGYSRPQIPVWTGDSARILYRLQHDGNIQLWCSNRDGPSQKQLSRIDGDVLSFTPSSDGHRIFLVVGPSHASQESAREKEAARGYHYDERMDVLNSGTFAPETVIGQPTHSVLWVYELQTDEEHPSSESERIEYEQSQRRAADPFVVAHTRDNGRGSTINVSLQVQHGGVNPARTLAIYSSPQPDHRVVCENPKCTGHFTGAWIRRDESEVIGLRWSGQFDYGSMTLLAWNPNLRTVRTLLTTDDLLEGCSKASDTLICGRSSATAPTAIVSISLATGDQRIIYDPNGALRDRAWGQVTPLYWQDGTGTQGFGHLVKPPHYQPGRRYPLVIVQYRSRGFLRGGTGDEYPIHVLAAKGFVVLSFHRPDDWALRAQSRSYEEVKDRGWRNFRDRKTVLGNLLAGIDEMNRRGLIDPKRVGITGLSDGAETLAFALIHASDRFAAAATSGSFWNPIIYSLGGPRLEPMFNRWNFLSPIKKPALESWRQISLALNADRIHTPLLIQSSDAESLSETQTYMAFKDNARPVDMYVFPNEFHVKSQPVHRYTIYRRNVQWFEFWLQGIEESDPAEPDQYIRWRALRALQTHDNLASRW
jgi:dipeptidyl aminopeptidase/acylaminoacyl peptidase